MDSLEKYKLNDETHEVIFRQEIIPDIFKNAKTCHEPIAVIFGGQPGSGKNAVIDLAVKRFSGPSGCILIIGDGLRDYHPFYKELLKHSDKLAAYYTDHDAGRWVEKLIAYAKTLKFNLIIEGTMRVKKKVSETMVSLKNFNYVIEAHVLAVNEKLSWQGILQRYENQRADRGFGRMTTAESHQESYKNLPDTLDYIEKNNLADKIIIYKRGGKIIYENERQYERWKYEPLARITLENERSRPWTLQARLTYARNFDNLVEMVKSPHRNITEEEMNTLLDLQKKAYEQINFQEKSTQDLIFHSLSKDTQALIELYIKQESFFIEAMDKKIACKDEDMDMQNKFCQLSTQARYAMLSISHTLMQREDFKFLHDFFLKKNLYDALELKNIAAHDIKEKIREKNISMQEAISIFKKISENSLAFNQEKQQSLAYEDDENHEQSY